MINEVILLGRICTDIKLQTTQSGKKVANFTIALDRAYRSEESDFVKCAAWESLAEHISKYFGKGRMIAVVGRLETRRWTDSRDGGRRQELVVVVSHTSFTGEKRETSKAPEEPEQAPSNGEEDIVSEGFSENREEE